MGGPLRAQASPFGDVATERLVRAAQVRHRVAGEDLSGYTADVFTRSEGTVGATRWAPDLTVIVHELLARVHWQRPNEVRIDVVGARNRSVRLPGVSARDVAGFWTEVFAGEPWFAPRFPGDEITLTGVPDRPARHPLAPDGERWYRYAITDSATLVLAGRTVHAVAVDVRPTRAAPFPLLTGQLWLDRDSLDVVRLVGALAGPGLWEEDDDESPVLVGIAIDLEYALHEGQWWLPNRQVVTTNWTYRYLPGAHLTGISTTTFANHRLAPDSSITFRTARDRRSGRWSTWTCDFAESGPQRCGREGMVRSRHRAGGRWEVVIPPLDDILAYPFDSAFAYHQDLMDEDKLTDRLIAMSTYSAAAPGGVPDLRSVDLSPFETFGFDRVRGPSLGAGLALHLDGPWYLRATVRLAVHGPWWTGETGFRREDASGRLDAHAFRRLSASEPWTPSGGLGPSLKALMLGHDDADWFEARGGELRWRGFRGRTAGWRLSASVEEQVSVGTASSSVFHDVLFGDGDFQANPAITEGWLVHAAAVRSGLGWQAGGDVLTGDHGIGGRLFARGTYGVVTALAGTTVGDVSPQQLFRLGGPWTVRGFEYGYARTRHLWALQVDRPILAGPFVALIPFADVAGDWTANAPAVGVGLGVSDSEGLLRLDVAVGLRPERAVRVDLRVNLQ